MDYENQEIDLKMIVQAINGLYENQKVINEKLNAILMLHDELNKKIAQAQEIESQLYNLSINLNKLDFLKNKMSDIEITLQNTSSDHDNISNSITEVMNHIDSLSRSFQQWKFYSEI